MTRPISPSEYTVMSQNDDRIDSLIDQVNQEIIKYQRHPWYNWVEILLDTEVDKSARDTIAHRFVKAGWYAVAHRTSSENGEQSGLTKFVFLTNDTFQIWIQTMGASVKTHHIVSELAGW